MTLFIFTLLLHKYTKVTEKEKKSGVVFCNEKNNRGNRSFSLSTESVIGKAIFEHFKALSNDFLVLI